MSYDVGERIREFRKQAGLNQDQLAELASLNRVTVAKYESGKVEPGAKAIARIADALEISVDVLLGRDPGTKKEPATAGRQSVEKYMRLNPENRRKIDELIALYLTAQSADQPPLADPE